MTNASPRGPRPVRSAAVTLTQSILALEAFATLFATTLLIGMARTGDASAPSGWIWGVGIGVTLLMVLAAGAQGRSRARGAGWALQVPLLGAGFLAVSVAAVGGMFVVLWIAAIRIGERIDRERAAYNGAGREHDGGDV